MKNKEATHTFTCEFGGGVTATATIDPGVFRASHNQTRVVNVEWQGQVKPRHVPHYRRWMIEVQQKAADLTSQKIMWAFQPDTNTVEIYGFEPGKPFRRIR